MKVHFTNYGSPSTIHPITAKFNLAKSNTLYNNTAYLYNTLNNVV